MKYTQFLLSTTLLGCAVVAQPAFADDASAQASPKANTVQEVVVTAEHRTSTVQKTAASVSVRTGSDMLLQGRYELANILEDVPGVTGGAATGSGTAMGSGSDSPARGLTIRGVQSNEGAGGSVTSTAASAVIYVDDVYSGIGGGYDIDRVEVLRGPQGTLYGRSATAGVVAIHTGAPSTTQFGADGSAEFGDYDLSHWTGEVNLPIIKDTLALRVSGNLFKRDGYYSAGDDRSSADFRAKALWTPTDNFSALLGYAQEYNVTHTGGVTINQVFSPPPAPPGSGSPTDFTFTPQDVAPGKNHSYQYWGDFNLNLGPVAITYIPAYRAWEQNATAYLRGGFNANQTIKTPTDWFMTHELRIHNTDKASPLQWQAGFLYYQNTLSDVNNLFLNPVGPYAFQSSTHKTTTAEGGFAEATYAFMPDTHLTVGLRYDHTQVLNNETYSAFGGPPSTLTGNQGLRTFDNFNYKVRLEHDLTPRNMLYAMISTGSSPGDIVLTTQAPPPPPAPPIYTVISQALRAETLTAYEIGSKNRFFDNHLQVNGDVYYNDYAAFQTAGNNVTPTGPNPTFATLAAPMKSYGAELEVLARPWDGGTISANGSYTNARYGSFGSYDFLFDKRDVPGVAPFQGSVDYDHRLDLGSATLLLHGDVRFFTAHYTASLPQSLAAYERFARVGNQAVGDLNATLLLGSHYSITAYVRNVTDTRFIPDGWNLTQVVPFLPPASNGVALSDPRTFGMILAFKY